MIWNEHSELKGCHAFLSASGYHWMNYSEEKLKNVWLNSIAKQRGTELHEFAAQCIKLKQKLPRTHQTLNMFVNDAIGYDMRPEQLLFYSKFCFGTTDAISFKKNTLRIHDLKTGETQAHIEQLMIYAAIFCLEYKIKPSCLKIILCIYQYDDIEEYNPDAEEIELLMNKIIKFDKILNNIEED